MVHTASCGRTFCRTRRAITSAANPPMSAELRGKSTSQGLGAAGMADAAPRHTGGIGFRHNSREIGDQIGQAKVVILTPGEHAAGGHREQVIARRQRRDRR
ncbi:MAG: hypothetical protein R2911_41340 [Caldilineaceae bacterium]